MSSDKIDRTKMWKVGLIFKKNEEKNVSSALLSYNKITFLETSA